MKIGADLNQKDSFAEIFINQRKLVVAAAQRAISTLSNDADGGNLGRDADQFQVAFAG